MAVKLAACRWCIGNWTYTHTIRRPEINDESPEVRMQIGVREYEVSWSTVVSTFHEHELLRENFVAFVSAKNWPLRLRPSWMLAVPDLAEL